jgi:hypothetical protein
MSIHFVMCNGITHFKDTYFKDNMVEGETSKGESNWTRRNNPLKEHYPDFAEL